MRRFVLDTNLYVRADRDQAAAAELSEFNLLHLGATYLHAVVALEILAGGVTPAGSQRLRTQYVAPFQARGRLVAPSFPEYARAGEVIGRLVGRGLLTAGGVPKSFTNDVLLAVSCREHGLTLVTSNVEDFRRIRRVLDFDFVPPWPD